MAHTLLPGFEMNSSITVTHIITETHGGAGVAARRLHEGLLGLGLNSRLVYRRGYCSAAGSRRCEPATRLWWRIREKVERYFLERQIRPGGGLFTDCRMPYPTRPGSICESGSLFHLHWTAWFLDWPTFFSLLPSGSPIHLYLHDTTFISGGCHQLDGCDRFQNGCGYCPKLRKPGQKDLSAKIFKIKKRLFSRHKLFVAANSTYTLELAKKSPLFESAIACEIIHPGVDTGIFKPLEKKWCRNLLHIPENKIIICFGAASTAYQNKGLDFLIERLNQSSSRDSFCCLVFGSGGERLRELKCEWRFVGYNNSEHLMAVVYSAADIFVMPSRMETFGLTALEAMACGVPVIASRVGGLVDIVQDGETGLLVPYGDAQAWTEAIDLLANRKGLRLKYGAYGRRRATEHFDIKKAAEKQRLFYLRSIYHETSAKRVLNEFPST